MLNFNFSDMKDTYLIVTPFFPTKDSFRGPFIYDQAKAIKDFGDYEVVFFSQNEN